jgi:hypothetical protein
MMKFWLWLRKWVFVLVVRKDPEGMVRIKARPDSEVDLTEAYHKVKALNPEATWFFACFS